jgi:eukaryotic-like serine/threonine-protein kinase
MIAAPAPGTILLGRYRVEDVLGIGGMGVVVRASHQELDTQVAIKFLLPHMLENQSVVQRFLREAQATVRLKGEHVAKVIDVGRMPDGAPFMVMEYLTGGDLGQVLKVHGPQPAMVACELMLQICEGMAEAHAVGIVHRDVKPSNFFVTRRPDGSPLVKILDFGISKVPVGAEMELTGTQSTVGTPAYMAPEHMRAANRADQRSDLWSMGVVLYQLLTNQLPFDGESYADLCLKVGMDQPAPMFVPLPSGLGEVVLRCLEKDPAQRYQSVAQLAYALAPYCSDPVVAQAGAERCARILEAPRGPRAPTLPVGTLGASSVPLTPYSQTGNRPLQSYPSSVSAGVGQISVAPGATKSRAAWYGAGAAAVLALGIGLGVFAAGDNGSRGTAVEAAPAALPVTAAAPAVAEPAAAPAMEPAAPAPPTAVAPPPAPPTQGLQGGAEEPSPPPAVAEPPRASATPPSPEPGKDLSKETATPQASKTVSSGRPDKSAEPKSKKKKKSSKDLFQSRE